MNRLTATIWEESAVGTPRHYGSSGSSGQTLLVSTIRHDGRHVYDSTVVLDMTEVMGEPCWFHQVMT
ncbi:hypothetical protein G9A89_021669, partial [Geosiphon pyriformis]